MSELENKFEDENYYNDPFSINELIIILANKYGYTQKNLVEQTGIHKSQMSRFFNKKEIPTKEQLAKFAEPLKVSKETLWIIAGYMLPPSKESQVINELKSLQMILSEVVRDKTKEELNIDVKLTATERQFIQEYIEFIKFRRRNSC